MVLGYISDSNLILWLIFTVHTNFLLDLDYSEINKLWRFFCIASVRWGESDHLSTLHSHHELIHRIYWMTINAMWMWRGDPIFPISQYFKKARIDNLFSIKSDGFHIIEHTAPRLHFLHWVSGLPWQSHWVSFYLQQVWE